MEAKGDDKWYRDVHTVSVVRKKKIGSKTPASTVKCRHATPTSSSLSLPPPFLPSLVLWNIVSSLAFDPCLRSKGKSERRTRGSNEWKVSVSGVAGSFFFSCFFFWSLIFHISSHSLFPPSLTFPAMSCSLLRRVVFFFAAAPRLLLLLSRRLSQGFGAKGRVKAITRQRQRPPDIECPLVVPVPLLLVTDFPPHLTPSIP